MAQVTTLSGGTDLRTGMSLSPKFESITGLSSLFVNLRTVFPDSEGDRVIVVGQGDVEEVLDHTHLYNVYAQYKGPLGKWNVRFGRYLVPFGLHEHYDTERLLLRAHEAETLGMKLDEGVQLFGFHDAFDYSASVSRGFQNRPTPIVRLGWHGDDVKIGVSYLYGHLPSFADEESVGIDELLPGAVVIRKHRAAIDYEQTIGPLILRAEPIAGADEGKLVYGGFAEAGYALSPDWELSAVGAYLHSDLVGTRWRSGAAVSYRVVPGVFARGAYQSRDDIGSDSHAVFAQVYAEFSHVLGGD